MCYSRLGPVRRRELTSVVLQCVELSVRQLGNGSIPSAAIRACEAACDERLAVEVGSCRLNRSNKRFRLQSWTVLP